MDIKTNSFCVSIICQVVKQMDKLIRERIAKADDSFKECVFTVMEVFDILLNIKELEFCDIAVSRGPCGDVTFTIGGTPLAYINND